MRDNPCISLAFAVVALVCVERGAVAAAEPINDYPTAARADYVFGCMATNGQTQEALQKCSCSIDHIASIMPYDQYVEAETVLRMRQVSGERVALFRDSAEMKGMVDKLRSAQAEAEFKCF